MRPKRTGSDIGNCEARLIRRACAHGIVRRACVPPQARVRAQKGAVSSSCVWRASQVQAGWLARGRVAVAAAEQQATGVLTSPAQRSRQAAAAVRKAREQEGVVTRVEAPAGGAHLPPSVGKALLSSILIAGPEGPPPRPPPPRPS